MFWQESIAVTDIAAGGSRTAPTRQSWSSAAIPCDERGRHLVDPRTRDYRQMQMSANATIRIGTSGFSYKEWLGGFYPEKLAGPKMLAHYAGKLPTVEINYTFRAMPRREMLEKW